MSLSRNPSLALLAGCALLTANAASAQSPFSRAIPKHTIGYVSMPDIDQSIEAIVRCWRSLS